MHSFVHFLRPKDGDLVIGNDTKENFSWQSEEMNVKFHKNCENAGKPLKISCERCNFVKFDIHFLGVSFSLVLKVLKNVQKECNIFLIILVQDFCPMKIKITQFHGEFRLNICGCAMLALFLLVYMI